MVIPKLTMEPKQNIAITFFSSYSGQGFSYDEKTIKFLQELKNKPLWQTPCHKKKNLQCEDLKPAPKMQTYRRRC